MLGGFERKRKRDSLNYSLGNEPSVPPVLTERDYAREFLCETSDAFIVTVSEAFGEAFEEAFEGL